MNLILKAGFLIILLQLSSCAALDTLGVIDAVNPMKDDKGIDANVQLGKNNIASETRGLFNARSDIKTRNDITAGNVYQNTSNKDSPWLIVAFAIMTGFFVMQAFNWFSAWRKGKQKKEVMYEIGRELNRIGYQAERRLAEVQGS